jgi:hypothetical protein
MPIVGLSNAPSGFAVTHVTLKSYVTVAAEVPGTNELKRLKRSALLGGVKAMMMEKEEAAAKP